MSQAYLILSNGQVYEGEAIGYWPEEEQAVLPEDFGLGELVFTTGMVGYLETLTDPSYAGQMILQGFPLIGNYGVIPEDFEGKCLCKGYVVRELCEYPSNFRSQYKLDRFLKEQKIPGICGIDTRQIVRTIREEGVMNAKLTASLPENLEKLLPSIQNYQVTGVVEKASSKEIQVFSAAVDAAVPAGSPAPAGTSAPTGSSDATAKPLYHIALMDYGAKGGIIRCLTSRGCEVTVFPATTPAETVLAADPDGIMLSNGPGDPKDCRGVIEEIKKLYASDTPIFAICLGHQLMALATGADTFKLKYGHRGGNHPVKDLSNGRVYISSQNHGYCVDMDKLDKNVAVPAFINVNDGTNEGLSYVGKNIFTVQFHPEACPGPQDSSYLFDRFVGMMKNT